MKVSKEKKEQIRKDLIQAAIEVITEKGYQSATMREISSKAGYGTATIYNYFPTKEKILYAYFEETYKELNEVLEKVPDIDEYTLKEKLQLQLESLLELYLRDREFVQEAYRLIFDSPLRTFTEFLPVKKLYTDTTRRYYREAVEAGEIPEHPLEKFIINLYWDYTGLIMFHWLSDTSEEFADTTQLIDMSLDIVVGILQAGIISRTAEVVSFLFKSHLYGSMGNIFKLFQAAKEYSSMGRNKDGEE